MAEWKRKKISGHTPEREQAEKLGFALDTLRKWRRQGTGQAYIVVGREIHYVDADEPRWLASLKVVPPRREALTEPRHEPNDMSVEDAAPAMPKRGRGRPRRVSEAPAPAVTAS